MGGLLYDPVRSVTGAESGLSPVDPEVMASIVANEIRPSRPGALLSG